jgi:hypothetical protein
MMTHQLLTAKGAKKDYPRTLRKAALANTCITINKRLAGQGFLRDLCADLAHFAVKDFLAEDKTPKFPKSFRFDRYLSTYFANIFFGSIAMKSPLLRARGSPF